MNGEGDLQGALGQLLSNPEALGEAMKIASSLKASGVLDGLLGGTTPGGKREKDGPAPAPDAYEKTSGAYGQASGAYTEEQHGEKPPPGASGGENERRRKLLEALRPYLSDERRQMLDGAVKILRLLEVAQGLNGIF